MSLAQYNCKNGFKNKGLKSTDFDFRIDIWSVCTIGIQLANDVIRDDPLSVCYMTNNAGTLLNPDLWSSSFIEFLNICKDYHPSTTLDIEQGNNPTPASLILSHNFLNGEVENKNLVKYVRTVLKKLKIATFPWCRRM